MIVGGLKFDHASPILRELHWLPIQKRVLFKICVMVFKCLNGLAPEYLSNKCIQISSMPFHEHLRSSDSNMLYVGNRNLKTVDRDFAVAGPIAWNGLPNELRQSGLTLLDFRRRLKTFLFDC